jgi:aspartyl-tRNA synthetase
VAERAAKNDKIPTGDVEIRVERLEVLNPAKVPPFTIEDNTDGGEDLRMKYRYLDLRRNAVRRSLELRHRMAQQTRAYLDGQNFIEVETPVLIKSTPEGARDFVVPSRMNPGSFTPCRSRPRRSSNCSWCRASTGTSRSSSASATKTSAPTASRNSRRSTAKCRSSRRKTFSIPFEGLVKHLFRTVKGIEISDLPRMSYADAMKYYGIDKPDTRFEMRFTELKHHSTNLPSQETVVDLVSGKNFPCSRTPSWWWALPPRAAPNTPASNSTN